MSHRLGSTVWAAARFEFTHQCQPQEKQARLAWSIFKRRDPPYRFNGVGLGPKVCD